MNHFEAQLMVLSRVVKSKVLRKTIHSEYFFSDKKKQNGEFSVENFRRIFFGMSSDVILQVTLNFELE